MMKMGFTYNKDFCETCTTFLDIDQVNILSIYIINVSPTTWSSPMDQSLDRDGFKSVLKSELFLHNYLNILFLINNYLIWQIIH